MKAILQSGYGEPSAVLRVAEVERPASEALKEDEVLVRVRAAAVHADLWHLVTGTPYYIRMLTGLGGPKHAGLGTDLAGVVESVGSRVTRFQPGDEVFGTTMRSYGLANGGAFAEYAIAPAQSLALKPPNVTFGQAASVAASGYIAYSNLIPVGDDLRGKTVLVNGAGGGVGTIAVQLLKARGAHVTVVDAASKFAMLRSLGADETIDYTQTKFVDQGIRYDLIFDVASNYSLDECRKVLKPGGLFIWIGHEHYGRAKGGRVFGSGLPKMLRLMMRGLFGDPNLPKMKFPPPIPSQADAMEALRKSMAEGKLTPFVETYPLDAVVEAFRRMEAGQAMGKIVLEPMQR